MQISTGTLYDMGEYITPRWVGENDDDKQNEKGDFDVVKVMMETMKLLDFGLQYNGKAGWVVIKCLLIESSTVTVTKCRKC